MLYLVIAEAKPEHRKQYRCDATFNSQHRSVLADINVIGEPNIGLALREDRCCF